MSITNLNVEQINVVAGGESQDKDNSDSVIDVVLNKLVKEIKMDKTIESCINVSTYKYGIKLCLPTKKPSACGYEMWGMLHDLPDEMSLCD